MTTPQDLGTPVTPRLRGVVHQYAFVAAVLLAPGLLLSAEPGAERLAAAIYATSVAGMFGTSALFHRVRWRRHAVRRWMRRLDHSMIFVLIAGTATPFAMLSVEGAVGTALLGALWAGAAAGVVLKLLWLDAPAWVTAGVYIGLGWTSTIALPALVTSLGLVPTALVALGGVLYTAGAVVYARRRPDPVPAVFGFHEVFHVLVVVAAALQYGVVAFWVL